MQSINQFIMANSVSVIGLCVLGIFVSVMVMNKLGGKTGGAILVVSAVVLIHTLRMVGILP